MKKIKFGTDGWREIIGAEFTFENVAKVSLGVAHALKEMSPQKKVMIFGYDRRFLSKAFAEFSAICFSNQGFEILFSSAATPTPALSWCAKNIPNAAGAVVITASHNPPHWNGFKFKETYGSSALPKTTALFEASIEQFSNTKMDTYDETLFKTYVDQGKIKLFDPMPDYQEALKKQVNTDLIRKQNFYIGIDPMHGSAAHHFAALLESMGVKTFRLRENVDPSFGGHAPEPTEENISGLKQAVKTHGLRCGFANDGDADRLCAVDENGNFFSTQKILSVVYWHMVKNRKKAWNISRSVSTTRMVDMIAKKHNLQCFETQVGFKYIAEQLIENKSQIGGEESGGIGIIDHLPERDGFLTALLLLELMSVEQKPLSTIYQNLCEAIRPYEFVRLDLKVPQSKMKNALEKLKSTPPSHWNNKKIETVVSIDGYKYYMEDGSWLLIRPSGTEPLFRIYAETENFATSQTLAKCAQHFVEHV